MGKAGRDALHGWLLAVALVVTGCTVAAPVALDTSTARPPSPAPESRNFQTIVARVEPVAENVCRSTRGQRNCDFRILLDPRPDQPPNAFQTVTSNGRPVLVVNATLLREMRNPDEIAFVLSHEAAHHIADHLPRQQQNVQAGAIAAGLAAAALGASPAQIAEAQRAGAFTGGRAYSKNFEIEADRLGAQIAYLAGYNPIRGVEYFARARDPGDVFLGTHPPNADRIDAVRDVMARRLQAN